MELGRELEHLVARSGSAPLLVWYGRGSQDRPGPRTELSAITVQNWIDKIINWLDELGVEPGEPIAAPLLVDHQAHWTSQLWAVAALVAGTPLVLCPGAAAAQAPLTITGPDLLDPSDLATAGWPIHEVIAASLHPLGMGFAQPLPDGVTDMHEVLAQPDVHLLPPTPDAEAPALVTEQGTTPHGELALAAMTTRQVRPSEHLVGTGIITDGLAAAIHAGRTVVLVEPGNPLAHIAQVERADLA